MSPSSMNSSNNSNTYGLVTNQNENCEELEIDENVVGAVIGPAGTISEFRHIENSDFEKSEDSGILKIRY